MKTLNILIPVFLFSLSIPLQTFAQGYTPPSQERVETLLEELENCKQYLTAHETLINEMEQNPEDYTLAQYNAAKKGVNNLKVCINARRAELDELRKDYPGWFNSPNATLPLSKGHSITPRQLKLSFEEIQEKINAAIERFKALNVPEH